MSSKHFGGKLSAQWKSVYQDSPNWKNGAFRNLEKTQTGIDWRKIPEIMCRQFKGHKEGNPKAPLPIAAFDKAAFLSDSGTSKFVWFGHSVILMRLNDRTILIDPMLGGNASPLGSKSTRRFSEDTLSLIEELPEIDLMLLTHDHYDHLDFESIQRLKSKTRCFYVALGVKRHLMRWGIDEKHIFEFDWWDQKTFHEIGITFTPTRHFSGRGITSLAKCLWGGWAFKTAAENIWFSGDGGYGDHFKEIGERLGPFDFAMMECGQYGKDWPQIHMFPDESVQAALDALVDVTMPVHWGGFNLSYHHAWFEPVEDFARHAQQQHLNFITPGIGEIFHPTATTSAWWMKHK